MTELEQLLEDESQVKEVDDVEAEREALGTLPVLGTTKEYLGKNMTLSDVHRFTKKDVKKNYKMYQMVNGQQVYNTLVRGSLIIFSKVLPNSI